MYSNFQRTFHLDSDFAVLLLFYTVLRTQVLHISDAVTEHIIPKRNKALCIKFVIIQLMPMFL